MPYGFIMSQKETEKILLVIKYHQSSSSTLFIFSHNYSITITMTPPKEENHLPQLQIFLH